MVKILFSQYSYIGTKFVTFFADFTYSHLYKVMIISETINGINQALCMSSYYDRTYRISIIAFTFTSDVFLSWATRLSFLFRRFYDNFHDRLNAG